MSRELQLIKEVSMSAPISYFARHSFQTAADQPSAFLPLPISQIEARRPNGTLVEVISAQAGRLALVAIRPIPKAKKSTRIKLLCGCCRYEEENYQNILSGKMSTKRKKTMAQTIKPQGLTFDYNQDTDVLSVSFGTGEPSLREELDDLDPGSQVVRQTIRHSSFVIGHFSAPRSGYF